MTEPDTDDLDNAAEELPAEADPSQVPPDEGDAGADK